MTIRSWQTKVDDWISTYGVRYFDELTNTVLLMEEVGELSRFMARQYGEQSFKSETKPEKVQERIEDEMGDILFVLTCLANQMEINLEDVLRKNLLKKTSRDDRRHKQNIKLSDDN